MRTLTKLKKQSIILFIFICCLLCIETVFAAHITSISLSHAANKLTKALEHVAKIMTLMSYIIGFCFGITAILKFKGYKDNPYQTTISTPISFTFLALAFVFMPMLFAISGDTVF